MSEYQYYEFQAIDRPLDLEAKAALRAISTRAHITATGFANSYEWGDLKADPRDMLKRHFDLFLYLANLGNRRFALKLPRRLVDLEAVNRFQIDDEVADIKVAGALLIIDIHREDIEAEDWDDGSSRLAALAPLRAELLAGDLRLFVLLWLMQVERPCPRRNPHALARIGAAIGAVGGACGFPRHRWRLAEGRNRGDGCIIGGTFSRRSRSLSPYPCRGREDPLVTPPAREC